MNWFYSCVPIQEIDHSTDLARKVEFFECFGWTGTFSLNETHQVQVALANPEGKTRVIICNDFGHDRGTVFRAAHAHMYIYCVFLVCFSLFGSSSYCVIGLSLSFILTINTHIQIPQGLHLFTCILHVHVCLCACEYFRVCVWVCEYTTLSHE